MPEQKHYAYSIPLGRSGRDFAFSLPDDFDKHDAETLSKVLPEILRNVVYVEVVDMIAAAGRRLQLLIKIDEMLDASELGNQQAVVPSQNGHACAADVSPEHVDKEAVSATLPKARVGAKLPAGKWSWEHDYCVKCERTDRPHMAKGLCKVCSAGVYKKQRREKKQAAGAAKPNIDPPEGPSDAKVVQPKAKRTAVQVDDEKTVPTPMRKAAWPLKEIRPGEALTIARRISGHVKNSSKPLSEIAELEGLDPDKVRKVYDTFRNAIQHALATPNFDETVRNHFTRRFEVE